MHCLNHYIIWSKVNNWWGLAWCCSNSLSTLFSQWDSLVNDKFQKKTWLMLFFLVLWSIWLFRNDVIFKQKTLDYDTLFFLIITRLCLWLKAIDSDFLYTASNVLRLVDGLLRWTNLQKHRLVVIWSPPKANSFKWNVNGSSLGKPEPSGICGEVATSQLENRSEVFFVSLKSLPLHVLSFYLARSLD
jgi:hypothetical protein